MGFISGGEARETGDASGKSTFNGQSQVLPCLLAPNSRTAVHANKRLEETSGVDLLAAAGIHCFVGIQFAAAFPTREMFGLRPVHKNGILLCAGGSLHQQLEEIIEIRRGKPWINMSTNTEF